MRPESPLLTDLYQLNMIQAYLDHGDTETAVFEFFVRTLPPRRGFLLAAGLEQALDYLENLRFSAADIEWLKSTGRFRQEPARLSRGVPLHRRRPCHAGGHRVLRQRADPARHRAAAAGAVRRIAADQHSAFPVADRRQGGAHACWPRPDKLLVDFGLRRAHGAEAGLMAARASYIAGFAGTATVLAGEAFGIPLYGTMAHSFIEAFDDESAAFETFARARPDNLVLLLDTYDTEAAARKVVALAPRLKAAGIAIRGVRLDSGDLVALSQEACARILDAGGLARRDDLCQRRARRGFARRTCARTGADRRFRRRHQPDHVIATCRRSIASTSCRNMPALPRRKRSEQQSHLARPQAGVAALRRRRPHGRRSCAGRLEGARTTDGGEPLLALVMRDGRRLAAAAVARRNQRSAPSASSNGCPNPCGGSSRARHYPVEVAAELSRPCRAGRPPAASSNEAADKRRK